MDLILQSKGRVAEWIKKKRPIYMLPIRDFRPNNTHRLKVRGWKKIFLQMKIQRKPR